uniref:Uncharacterized protein n=1 Tax=Psilocybe cubensis TaxID=181762 RepID=A0A8H7XNX9_PSICU
MRRAEPARIEGSERMPIRVLLMETWAKQLLCIKGVVNDYVKTHWSCTFNLSFNPIHPHSPSTVIQSRQTMVSALAKYIPRTRDTSLSLRARYYGAHAERPVNKAIHTLQNTSGRSPRLDLVMGGKRLQPYIHDAIVSISNRGKIAQFHVFVKNHCRLPPNRSIRRWRVRNWKGDIVVFKKGKHQELVRPDANMKFDDTNNP